MAELTTWNNYIKQQAEITPLNGTLTTLPKKGIIAYGSGLSYGDAPLSEFVALTTTWSGEIELNRSTGIVTCKSGTTLAQLLEIVIPEGWFLPVTPGTKNITVGGAVAANVHGKNHLTQGSFSEHVTELTIQNNENNSVRCSRQEHPDLFNYSFGGMGLTGIILSVTIQLMRIDNLTLQESNTVQDSLESLLDAFEQCNEPYKIAWISNGTKDHFKSIFTAASPASDIQPITYTQKKPWKLFTPLPLVNSLSISLHNYMRHRKMQRTKFVHLLNFMYPLDAISNWNHAYGNKGFIQYQFAIPMSAKYKLMDILQLAFTKATPFLTVLKQLGKENIQSPLSFPMEGYTLAMDFRITAGLLPLLAILDEKVVEAGGRVYLAKDSRLSAVHFQKMYPQWELFRNFIQSEMQNRFCSRMSDRLKLTNYA